MDSLAQGISMLQSSSRHEECLGVSRDLHLQSQAQHRRHHNDALAQEAHHHKRDVSLKWQLYAKQRAFAMDMARREAVRDVWQQRNELVQTMLIVSTLLFGCNYTTLSSGRMPEQSNAATLMFFWIFVGLSMTILLCSIFGLVVLHRRISNYDIHKPLKRYPVCNRTHSNFNDYYSCHCEHVHRRAMVLFYLGSCTTYVACSIMLLGKMILWYLDPLSCGLFCIPLSLGLIFAALASYFFPDRTRAGADDYGGLSGESTRAPQIPQPVTEEELGNGANEENDVALISIDAGTGSVPAPRL